MYHMHPHEDLEGVLELIDDPIERAQLIEEAFALLGTAAVETEVEHG